MYCLPSLPATSFSPNSPDTNKRQVTKWKNLLLFPNKRSDHHSYLWIDSKPSLQPKPKKKNFKVKTTCIRSLKFSGMCITETIWFHHISEWGKKMSGECHSVCGGGRKDKVQKVVLCLYMVFLSFRVMQKREGHVNF